MALVNCSEMIDLSEKINPENHFVYTGPVGRVTGEYNYGPSGDIIEYPTPTGGWYISLRLAPANERRRYKVTPSLIGCAPTYNQTCLTQLIMLSSWYRRTSL